MKITAWDFGYYHEDGWVSLLGVISCPHARCKVYARSDTMPDFIPCGVADDYLGGPTHWREIEAATSTD